MIGTNIESVDRKDDSVQVVDQNVREAVAALLTEVDAHLQTVRQSVERSEAVAKEKKKLLEALPASLPAAPTGIRVAVQCYKADGELTFDVSSREQVLALFEALPGVPVVRVDGGVSAFVPEERFDNSNPAVKSPTPVAPLVYRVAHTVGKLQEEYSWWTRLGGLLVRIHAVNAKQPTAKVMARHTRLFSNQIKLVWDYKDLPKGTVKYWYGARTDSAAPVTIHLERGASIRDAYSQVMTALYSHVTTDCVCN